MKTEFNYGDIKFEVDSATHEIYINGELASGAYAPVGGIVVDMDVETPDICEVITNIGDEPQEKIIVYGAPLSIKEPVIILGDWVIPSSLMVRNDLQDDYEVYKALLGEDYLRLLGKFNSAADSAKNEINAAKEEAISQIGGFLKDGIQQIDYTAWEVYPTLTRKAVGEYKRTFIIEGEEVTFSNKEAIPANATEFIKIFTSSPAAQSDVVVDWGDGSRSVIANGDYDNVAYDDNGETIFDLTHTYEEEGFFIVKVYGKGYWKISHPTINSKSLMSRVFADDLPIASHLSNMSAFCAFTDKLLYVDVPPYHRIVYAANLSSLFTHAKNLQRVTGFKRMYNAYNVGGMFCENQFLKYTDFRFSPDMYVADTIFQSCGELTVDINKMFQNQDGYYLEFKNSYVNLYRAFINCASLIGTISDNLKNILWNSFKTTFKSTETFTNASNLISQIPTSWGGTNTSITDS